MGFFFITQVTSASLLEARRTRIEQWMQQTSTERLIISPETQQASKDIIEGIMKDFDLAIEELRELRGGEMQQKA